MAELAACNAGTEIKLADGDAVVLDVIRKVIVALCHGTNEDCDTLVFSKTRNVVADTHDFGVEAERDLAAVRREVIGDGVLDYLNKLLLGRSGPDLMSVEQLHHQTSESLECSRNADCWADADQHILRRLNVDLELARLVDWRVEQGEKTLCCHVSWRLPQTASCTHLVCDIRPSLTDVAPHFAHHTDVIVAVEEVVLVFARTWAPPRAVRRLVRLERRIAQDDDHALRVFVVGGDWSVLLGDQLGQLWWWH